jgi:hypothetical protein
VCPAIETWVLLAASVAPSTGTSWPHSGSESGLLPRLAVAVGASGRPKAGGPGLDHRDGPRLRLPLAGASFTTRGRRARARSRPRPGPLSASLSATEAPTGSGGPGTRPGRDGS